MPEKIKTRIKNGQKQYLLKFKCGLIDFVNDEERKSLALSYETLKEASENGLLRLPRSTMIVGDGVYNGYWHPDSELAKSYAMFDRQPWNVNHGDDVNSEIGWWEQPQKNGNKYSAIPILNLNTPEGKNALSHIQNRMLAGKPAELSIGFWCGVKTERVKHGDIDQRLPVCYDIEPDHCSLVTRGACSPAVGAGIGLKQLEEEGIQMDEKPENVTDAQKTVEQKDADTKTKQPIQFNSKEEFQGAVHQSLASYFQKQKQEDEEEDEKALLEKRLKELESQNQGFQKNMEDMQKVLKSGEKPTRKTLSMAQYMQMEKPKQSNSLKKTGVLYMNHVKQCIMAGTKPQGMYYREKFNEEYGCYTGQLQQINRGLLGQEFHTYDTAGPDIDTWDTDKLPPEMWAGSIFEDMVTKQKLLKYVLRRYDSPRKVTVPVKVWADATWTSTRGRDVRSNADDQDYSAQGIALDPTRYRTMAKIYRDSLEEATWNVEADVRERLRIATDLKFNNLIYSTLDGTSMSSGDYQTAGESLTNTYTSNAVDYGTALTVDNLIDAQWNVRTTCKQMAVGSRCILSGGMMKGLLKDSPLLSASEAGSATVINTGALQNALGMSFEVMGDMPQDSGSTDIGIVFDDRFFFIGNVPHEYEIKPNFNEATDSMEWFVYMKAAFSVGDSEAGAVLYT